MPSAKPHLADFASALKRAMVDIEVQELADHLGVSRQTVSSWRSGRSAPELTRVGEIERRLELNRGELLQHLAGSPEPADPPAESDGGDLILELQLPEEELSGEELRELRQAAQAYLDGWVQRRRQEGG